MKTLPKNKIKDWSTPENYFSLSKDSIKEKIQWHALTKAQDFKVDDTYFNTSKARILSRTSSASTLKISFRRWYPYGAVAAVLLIFTGIGIFSPNVKETPTLANSREINDYWDTFFHTPYSESSSGTYQFTQIEDASSLEQYLKEYSYSEHLF